MAFFRKKRCGAPLRDSKQPGLPMFDWTAVKPAKMCLHQRTYMQQ